MRKCLSKIAGLMLIISAAFLLIGCNDEFEIDTEDAVTEHRTYYESEILPHYETGEAGYFTGVDNIKIAFKIFSAENSKGAIVLFHGKSENMSKYAEFVYDFKDTDYSIYLLDHRSHGASGRLLTDPLKVHADDYSDFVEDANTFIEDIVKQREGDRNLFLISHSLGGAIAGLYLEEYPNVFTAAVLCSPLQSINTNDVLPMTENTAHALARTSVFFGKGEKFGLNQDIPEDYYQDVSYNDGQTRFFTEHVSHSYKRWLVNEEHLFKNPELLAGGALIGSTWTFIDETYVAIKKARKNAGKIKTPLLMLQAGDDHFVTDKGHDQFVDNLNDGVLKEFIRFDTEIYSGFSAYHEILYEVDEIRDVAIDKIKTFIDSFE